MTPLEVQVFRRSNPMVGVAVVGLSTNVPDRLMTPQVRNYRLAIDQEILPVSLFY